MNEERLRLIRGLYEAMGRRDVQVLKAFGRRFPDFEWRSAPDEVDNSPRHGAASALTYSHDLFELFAESETTIEEEIDLGPDRAILAVRHRMRGAASGAQTERREAHLWSFGEDGRVSLHEHTTVEEARKAAEA